MKKKTKKAKRSFDHRVVKKKPDQTLASPPPEMKKKMKKKAKRSFDHRVVASTAGCADLGDGKVKSSTDYGQPVYLVWPLLSGQPTFSVFMVEAAAALADGADPPRARTVAGIPGARRGMSFVATHSVQGSWIVGVGGKEGNTVIYDPSAMKTFEGPELSYPKHQPILISLDSKVYAISRRPTVYDKKYDFVPWFESLSFKKGVPGISGEKFSFWKALPPPPFFPFMLDPLEYCNPPTVSVSSYAAFGSHILLSPDCKETGTYAFHVVEETWEKVCNNNMPFVGQAVALGGGLFAACSTIHNNFATAAIVFRMSIIKGSSIPGASVKLIVRSLSTLPLASMGDPPLPLLCPAGKGSFCSIKLGQGFCEGKDHVQIILTAFKIDNIEAVLTASQTEHADASVLQLPVEVHHQNQTYLLEAPFPFKNPCMPVIALLSMDRELAEPFEVERSKKKAREWF